VWPTYLGGKWRRRRLVNGIKILQVGVSLNLSFWIYYVFNEINSMFSRQLWDTSCFLLFMVNLAVAAKNIKSTFHKRTF